MKDDKTLTSTTKKGILNSFIDFFVVGGGGGGGRRGVVVKGRW